MTKINKKKKLSYNKKLSAGFFSILLLTAFGGLIGLYTRDSIFLLYMILVVAAHNGYQSQIQGLRK